MQTRLDKWDRQFLALAEFLAGWSKDPSTGVGCVLADSRHRIVGTGYNGFPIGVRDTEARLEDRETKLLLTQHAERNAVAFSTKALEGCTVYTWPLPTCAPCAGALIQVGVGRVVSPELPPSHERWKKDFNLAMEMYQEAEVTVDLAPAYLVPPLDQAAEQPLSALNAYTKLGEAERLFRKLGEQGDTPRHQQLKKHANKLLDLHLAWSLSL